MKTIKHNVSPFQALNQRVADFQMLLKVRLTSLVVFSSAMAYLIAVEGSIDWLALAVLCLGGFLVTGASNTLNQVLEKDYDILMKRTANRPLATGRMTVSTAVLVAGFLSLLGIMMLASFNAWTGLLGMIALISYAFIYTPMKRISPIAVLVGAFPGALPTLIGCVAIQGELTSLGVALFGIQFMWQFPHFWAIAWLGDEDYKNAGFNLLPGGVKDSNVGFQSFIYAMMLIPIGVMPFLLGVTGIVSAIILVLLGAIYAYYGWNLCVKCTREAARKLMFCSFFYLPIALIALFIDKL